MNHCSEYLRLRAESVTAQNKSLFQEGHIPFLVFMNRRSTLVEKSSFPRKRTAPRDRETCKHFLHSASGPSQFLFLLVNGSDFSPLPGSLSWEERAGGARDWLVTSQMKAKGGGC